MSSALPAPPEAGLSPTGSPRRVMSADKTIQYSPEKSVVRLKTGDEIKLTESDFVALFKALFAEIEKKFM